jgi:CTP synthase (UTP-ammonia lyase)
MKYFFVGGRGPVKGVFASSVGTLLKYSNIPVTFIKVDGDTFSEYGHEW